MRGSPEQLKLIWQSSKAGLRGRSNDGNQEEHHAGDSLNNYHPNPLDMIDDQLEVRNDDKRFGESEFQDGNEEESLQWLHRRIIAASVV